MTVKASTVLKNKFWIVEDNGEKIGTLSYNDDRYLYSCNEETCFFDNQKQVLNKFGTIQWDNDIPTTITNTDQVVHGYPTSVIPYNTMYDVKQKLPLFTKSPKSNSLYCAGYYIIHFDKGWVKSFCPKMVTIERYETKGPFKTDIEMRQELSLANR
jgi:hypothetical protein|tara:strand:- start:1010 stop:1477 length:468 start_codon:yes stop_codon:yes gene_type:complete